MRRYIILATAILAAILVMSLIKAWQARRAKARGEEVQSGAGIGFEHIAGALVGLAVFFAGVMFLESEAFEARHEISAGTDKGRQDFVRRFHHIVNNGRLTGDDGISNPASGGAHIHHRRHGRRFCTHCRRCGARLASGQANG